MKSTVVNLVTFKAGWIAVVAGAAASIPGPGSLVAAAVIAFHLWRTRDVRAESLLLGAAALMGLLWESALVSVGLIQYDNGFILPGVAPYWIVAMWVLFATTLNVGMRWLRSSFWVASFAGAVGGPMAFLAGQKMGAVSFADPATAYVVIGIGWALLLPLLVRLSVRFDGHADTQRGAQLVYSPGGQS